MTPNAQQLGNHCLFVAVAFPNATLYPCLIYQLNDKAEYALGEADFYLGNECNSIAFLYSVHIT